MNPEEPARQGRADQSSRRVGCIKASDGTAAVTGAKPVCQVDDHAGEKAGFGSAQQKTGRIELGRSVYKSSKNRDDSPGDHDSRHPLPRAPAFDNHGSGYFEENIGDIKHSYTQAVDAVAEAQIRTHP